MASQVNLDKKRVANVGNSKKGDDKIPSFDEDIVSEIIKSMGQKLVSYKELEECRERHNYHSPNPEVTAPEVKPTKKYLLPKKHPLMEKCQRNLKYLKHNLSVPKQRAHLGEICIPKNIIKKVIPPTNSNTSKVLNKKKKSPKEKIKITSKKEVQKCSFPPINKEGKSELHSNSEFKNKQAIQLSNDSSDSECEFEEFIRVQKELLESEDTDSDVETISSRHKKKKQKNLLECEYTDNEIESTSNRHKKKKQRKLLECEETDSDIESTSSRPEKKKQRKLLECEETDSEMESTSSRHKYKKHKKLLECENSEIDSTSKKKKQKVVKYNSRKSKHSELIANSVPDEKVEESDFEMNEYFSFDSDSSESIVTTPHLELENDGKSNTCCSVNSNLSLDLTKADTISYISKKFSCAVRVERNPILDEKVISSLIKETNISVIDSSSNENQSNILYSMNKKKFETRSSPPRLNSDEDECMIVCEVPRSNNTVKEKSGESVEHINYLNDSVSNKTLSCKDLGFEPQNKSSQLSKNSPEIDIEILDDSAISSSDKPEIQILSVESLNTHLNNDYSVDNEQNSKELEKNTLNENLSYMVQISKKYTDCSENQTMIDPLLLKKDFFKYAKTYSEPQNSIDNNAQTILKPSAMTNEINDCLDKIDLKLINSTLKQPSCSEYLANNCYNAVEGKDIPVVPPLESPKYDFNCDKNQIHNDEYVKDTNPLPSHILEIAQKIDFKKVLSLTKLPPNKINESNSSMKHFHGSSSSTESNLMKNSAHQSVISSNPTDCCFLSPNETINNQENLALHHRLGVQSVESCSQILNKTISELTDTFKTKVEKYIESPSDELDGIATAHIKDLNEQQSKDFIPLFHLYIKELIKYKKIKSAEQNVSEGLKILEENQFEKLKYLDKAIQGVLKHDPCSLKVVDKAKFSKTDPSLKNNVSLCKQEALNNYREQSKLEDRISINQQAKVCNNCGLLAKMKCLGCEKVYFCSEKCGRKFWEEGHVSTCQKDPPIVKTENKM